MDGNDKDAKKGKRERREIDVSNVGAGIPDECDWENVQCKR